MVRSRLLGWFSLLVGAAFLLLDLTMVISQPYLLAIPFSLALILLYALAGAGLVYLGWKALWGSWRHRS